ncbi:Metallo-dependent phosphatase [Canariomyces notabilis]|uniref:Metallo-dependent phosphatase n=1 Tax=Canariomyces notabilis TaxID=2074819 RepID=A0AAN6TN37_9PEZI|nr:Metallo-dependent phosphatase [Canariomyces arenarius]
MSRDLDHLLRRPRPSTWSQFLQAPCVFLARQLFSYHTRRHINPRLPPITHGDDAATVSIVCISDTHNTQPPLPAGDILIHAGDLTQSGSQTELQSALAWLRAQPHKHKIVIAGNHDQLLDPARDRGGSGSGDESSAREALDWGDIIYLQDSSTILNLPRGRVLRVYGSPRSPRHGNWAFQYPRSDEVDVWGGVVPEDTDVLVTHAPPRAHLDHSPGNLPLGCAHLLRELWRVRPRVHVFGHVHEGYGSEWVAFDEVQEAYERVMLAGGGVGNLFRLVKETGSRAVGSDGNQGKGRCLLVNAAMVGGLRDDQVRKAVVVYI